jgi:hypothetical protein
LENILCLTPTTHISKERAHEVIKLLQDYGEDDLFGFDYKLELDCKAQTKEAKLISELIQKEKLNQESNWLFSQTSNNKDTNFFIYEILEKEANFDYKIEINRLTKELDEGISTLGTQQSCEWIDSKSPMHFALNLETWDQTTDTRFTNDLNHNQMIESILKRIKQGKEIYNS